MLRAPVRFFEERFARHGYVFKTRTIQPVVFLVGAEANQMIMITQRDSFSYKGGYGMLALGRTFANSIMIVDGDGVDGVLVFWIPSEELRFLQLGDALNKNIEVGKVVIRKLIS